MTPVTSEAAGPPPIFPVTPGEHRPFWSVMIPTYNCAVFLRKTLASVLEQDPGPEAMQIEVVDDCSTKDDPGAVVQELGNGRVGFFRHPQNLGGPTPNFNACLARSRGLWVHILHGDDFVLPGFYEAMQQAIAQSTDVAILFSRSFLVDEHDEINWITPRLKELEGGGRVYPPLHTGNPIQTPSVVVQRAFYESHGGFDPRLVHVADWEMWLRATVLGGARLVNRPLAAYREFSTNHTGRLARTAENLEDYVRLAQTVERNGWARVDWPGFRLMVASKAAVQARAFGALGDADGEAANWRFWRKWVNWAGWLEYWGRRWLRKN